MIHATQALCKNYFSGFHDLSNCSKNSFCKNALAIAKVASYFFLVLPLFFGTLYAISSLLGRVCCTGNLSDEAKKTSVEKQLESFFKSKEKIKKLFTIEGHQVGLIFDPTNAPFKVGFTPVKDPIALVSDQEIPEKVKSFIDTQKPENCTYTTICLENVNGVPTFEALGFKPLKH